MTVKNVNIQFAVATNEEPMAVVRDANTYDLLSVFKETEASELYRILTKRNMKVDSYEELRAVRSSEESSTEHS